MPVPGLLSCALWGVPISSAGDLAGRLLFMGLWLLVGLGIAYGMAWTTAWLTGGQPPSIREAFQVLGSFRMIGQRGRMIRAILPMTTPAPVQRGGKPQVEAAGPPGRVATLFKLYPGHWGLAGSWAMALFLGREHEDNGRTVIAVQRRDLNHLWQHLLGWHPHYLTAGSDGPVYWSNSEPLPPGVTRLMAKPVSGDIEELEILLLDSDGDEWVHHHGDGRVRLPLDEAFTTSSVGMPVIAPEVCLLLLVEDGGGGAQDPGYAEVTAALGHHKREWLTRALMECDGEG